jgi:hypothetical protein
MLGLTGSCPVSFADEQLLEIKQEFQEYRHWHDVQEFARSYFDTDADGWKSPELDITGIHPRNKSTLDKYIKEMSKHMSPRDARRMWPYLENI